MTAPRHTCTEVDDAHLCSLELLLLLLLMILAAATSQSTWRMQAL
jgi:hypothetical protein